MKVKILYLSSKRFLEDSIFRAYFAFEITAEVRIQRKGADIKSVFHLTPNNYFFPKFLRIALCTYKSCSNKEPSNAWECLLPRWEISVSKGCCRG